jgi:hypothetical protein
MMIRAALFCSIGNVRFSPLKSPGTGKDKEAWKNPPIVFKSTISSADEKMAEARREEEREKK